MISNCIRNGGKNRCPNLISNYFKIILDNIKVIRILVLSKALTLAVPHTMILNKLGVKTKGKKYFWLVEKEKTSPGWTVTCENETGRKYIFNNVTYLDWLSDGEQVYLQSFHHEYDHKSFDLAIWAKVTITVATEIKPYLLDIVKGK